MSEGEINEPLFLDPPAVITSGTYQMFGAEYDTDEHIRSLEELGLEQLYPKEHGNHHCVFIRRYQDRIEAIKSFAAGNIYRVGQEIGRESKRGTDLTSRFYC